MTGTNGIIHNMDNKDIENKIEDYLLVKDLEKNKFGEVFTPTILIHELFDKLPANVWSNPDLKWLDPANGIGNFSMVAYQKLMSGLSSWEPNEKKRSKHIVENMLYMIELNPKNVKISKKIFGSKANICCANFLTNSEKCFSTNHFDIIMGNPPFQDDKSGETAQGGHDLYPKFFIKSFELLNNNGFLAFINPCKWRAPNKKGDLKQMWDIFVSNNPIYLKIYGFKDTIQLFRKGANTRIDYYILQKNTNKYNNTIVNDEENKEYKINLRQWDFLPNYNINAIKRILTNNNGVKIIYHPSQYDKRKSYMSEKKHSSYKYPVLHSHTNKDGNIFYWANTKEPIGNKFVPMFGIPKVILIKGLYSHPYNDYKGEYGMSNYSFGIPIHSKKEGDAIVKAINSEEFKNLLKSTKWSSRFTDHTMFEHFKPDFYKHFLHKNKTKKSNRTKKSNKTKKRK
jgi:hypothetical protein